MSCLLSAGASHCSHFILLKLYISFFFSTFKNIVAVTFCLRIVIKVSSHVFSTHQRSLKETFQKYPEPEELIQCVTWDDMQAALLGETESTHKVRDKTGIRKN